MDACSCGGRMGARAGVYAARGERIVAAMPLDDLLRLVETLRARIDAHGEALRGSEALTRYALIDPLLRELGWDTSDPAQVVPEYSLKRGYEIGGKQSADYALFKDDAPTVIPTVILEAKKMGTPLHKDSLGQALTYCFHTGTPYAVITDGRQWEIYDAFRQDPSERLTVEFDVAGSPAEVCRKAIALWRPGVLAGQVRATETPVVSTITKSVPDPIIAPSDPPPGWTSLDRLQPQKGDKPAELRFSDGHHVSTTTWAAFISELAAWLVSQGYLSEDQSAQYKKYGSGSWIVRRARKLVGDAGLDPKQFWVRLQD